jgi:hypothetical protein
MSGYHVVIAAAAAAAAAAAGIAYLSPQDTWSKSKV